MLPVLWGCQTAPRSLESTGDGSEALPGQSQFHREDAAFLKIADGFARSGEMEFFFSFETWPAGRSVAGEYIPDAVRGIERVRRIWGSSSSPEFFSYTLVMEMSVSRFLSSIALNAEGWNRTDWGVWQHPDEAVTVTFHPGRFWVVTAGGERTGEPAGENGGAIIPDGAIRNAVSTAGPVGNDRSYPAGVLVLDSPELEGIPPEFAPLEMRAYLFGSADVEEGSVSVELTFPDERRARIALVPLRLRASRFLDSFGFVLGDDFDILRSGAAIHMRGMSLVRPKGALSADGN